MAKLTDEQRDAVTAEAQRLLSQRWLRIPVSKLLLRAAVGLFDDGLETAETQIVTSVAAAARTWLINNAWIARHLLVMIAEKRRDVL